MKKILLSFIVIISLFLVNLSYWVDSEESNIPTVYKTELTKQLLLLKNNLKTTKWNKYVNKFDELIPKLSDEKLLSINEKLEEFDLTDNKYAKYIDILGYFKIKIWLESYVRGIIKEKENIIKTNTPLVVEAWRLWINIDILNKCIAENKYVDKINSQMKVGAETFGITWTPWNVLINNESWEYVVISGAYPKESFIKNIDNLLAVAPENIDVETESNTSGKEFKKNTDSNTLILISDSRDSSFPVDQIVTGLQEIETVKNMTVVEYDFSDNGVEEFLNQNNINALPAIIFAKKDVDVNVNNFLVRLNDNAYSLNIWATFNPFQKLSEKWFKLIDKDLLEQIRNNSYIDWNKNAKITWLEYSDLECPFCAKLHNSDVEYTLKAKYGDDLNIIFNHFPLWFHQKALPAANILECVWELGWSETFYKILKYAYKNEIQE